MSAIETENVPDPSETALARRVLEGEIVDDTELAATVRVIVLRSPFSLTREEHQAGEGQTLAEIIERLDLHRGCTARVFVGDILVPEAWWSRVRPKAGRTVTIRAVPHGGRGGGAKSIIGIVLGIVLIVASFIPGLQFLIGPGIGLVIGGVASLILAPTPGKFAGLSDAPGIGSKESLALAITGSRNRTNLYGVIPRVYGRYKVFPPDAGVIVTFEDGQPELVAVRHGDNDDENREPADGRIWEAA
jgi:hypothetical protein